ncbi:hypothetical protein ACSBR1_026839 [Camellia fascicularis]
MYEYAFSTSGRLVSPYRSRLHSDTLEALMCAQSWLWVIEMPGFVAGALLLLECWYCWSVAAVRNL